VLYYFSVIDVKKTRWSNSTYYNFVIGRLRTRETLLLDRNYYERLIRTGNVNDLTSVLNETSYARFISDAANFQDALELAGEENLQFCLDYAAEDWLQHLLQLQVDTHNIKTVLKSQLAGKTVEENNLLDKGRWTADILLNLNPDAATVRVSKKTGFDAIKRYVLAALQHARDTRDPALIDIMLDRWAQEQALSLTSGQDYARGYFELFADVTNIKILFRLRLLKEKEDIFNQAFLPGGKLKPGVLVSLVNADTERIRATLATNRFAPVIEAGLKTETGAGGLVLERAAREVMLNYINTARYVALGYEPLLRFYFLRENELVNLRQLFAAKVAGLDTKTCQELVVYGF